MAVAPEAQGNGIGKALLEERLLVHALGLGRARHDLHVDQHAHQECATLLGRHLLQLLSEIFGGKGEVRLGDLIAVDRGNDRRRIGRLLGGTGRLPGGICRRLGWRGRSVLRHQRRGDCRSEKRDDQRAGDRRETLGDFEHKRDFSLAGTHSGAGDDGGPGKT
jgi:GNAT superfamily N-acetyltransferase